jgi:predicted aspartyl protease
MSYHVTYEDEHPYASGGRPFLNIRCHGVKGEIRRPAEFPALIDTGADNLVLPNSVAEWLKIDLDAFSENRIQTANGIATVRRVPDFMVEFNGQIVKVLAEFSPVSPALLGIRPLLSVVDLGLQLYRFLLK